MCFSPNSSRLNFNPRPPRGGRLPIRCSMSSRIVISIHALREEGDQAERAWAVPSRYFNPRPPRGGRPEVKDREEFGHWISIHALREEGDVPPSGHRRPDCDFNPRPPRGGRPLRPSWWAAGQRISIHALREEGDGLTLAVSFGHCQISIHALREEGDTAGGLLPCRPFNFNPRPPRGGRQQKRRKNPPRLFHYTHLCTI